MVPNDQSLNVTVYRIMKSVKRKTIESTPFGPIVVVWSEADDIVRVIRVFLSDPTETALKKIEKTYPEIHEASCEEINSLTSNMLRLLEGESVDFSLDIADLSICGKFQQRVLRAEHAIPGGQVSTYKIIAVHLGVPKGSRAVGNALANNPFPLIIPCHRAIRSDLTLGGYQGGLGMKQALLSSEGIIFNDSGKVKCTHLYYQNDIRR